jgi:hypothetical protein
VHGSLPRQSSSRTPLTKRATTPANTVVASAARALVVLTISLVPAVVWAQISVSARLAGAVTDSGGAALPGVTVTATSDDTGLTRVTQSGGDGAYALPQLPPGRYRVTGTLDGFTTTIVENVVLQVDDQVSLPLMLQVAPVEQTVTVVAPQALLQTQSAQVSAVVGATQIRQLPLNGKDFADLIRLVPGVGGDAGGAGTNPSISGARLAGNSFTIDGVGANDERLSTAGLALGGGAASFDASGPNLVPSEAIAEFRVVTSNADATYGRGSGGQVNLIVRSGTNQRQSSLYEYFRDDSLDARNFFAAEQLPFRQHLFGGSHGGPLRRDRDFLFASYEGFRQDRQVPATLFAPNADLIRLVPGELGGLYQAFYLDRGIVPPGMRGNGRFFPFPSPAQAVAAGYPATLFDGNEANGEAGSIEILSSGTTNIDQDSVVLRTDHHLSGGARLSLRYAYSGGRLLQSTNVPTDFTETPTRWHSGVGQWQHALSGRQLMEVRAGWQYSFTNILPEGGVPESLTALGVSPDLGIVVQPGTGDSQLFVSTSSGIDRQQVPQLTATHTLSLGRWTWRTGLDIRAPHVDQANVFTAQPIYTFTGFLGPTGILGTSAAQPQAVAGSAAATVFGADGGPTTALRRVRAVEQEYFAQADWRVRPDVTLNLGLRYSYFGVYREADDALSNLYAVDSSGAVRTKVSPFEFGRTANRIEAVGERVPFYQPDRNNWQPRLGAAWDLGGRGQTVARAAYGLYYDRLYQLIFSGVITNPPFAVSSSAANVPFVISQPFPFSPSTAPPAIQALNPLVKNPHTHRFNVSVEQRLTSGSAMTLSYVGSRARDLIRTLDPNGAGFIAQPLRPDPRFTDQRVYDNYSSADYDALQVFLRGRLGGRLDMTAAYTYSRMFDDNAADRTFFPRLPSLINIDADPDLPGIQGTADSWRPRPAASDWGRSDFDVPHSLAASHVWALPAGVWFNGILRVRSGTPFTVTLGRDVNDDGDASRDRPAPIAGLDAAYQSGGDKRQYLVPYATAAELFTVGRPVTDPSTAMRRNAFRSPLVATYDLSLVKRFAWGRGRQIDVDLNAFNVFNRTNLGVPQANLTSFGTPNLRFGEITNTVTAARQIQIGVHVRF